MDKLVLIFRRKNPKFFSIEKIFNMVAECAAGDFIVEKKEVPFHSGGLLNILKNILFINKQKAEIVHITGDIHYGILGVTGSQSILTIHDCNFLYNYSGLKRKVIKILFLDLPVRRSSIITTISEKSKVEIIEATNCDPGKIMVIPNPVSDDIYFLPRKFPVTGVKVLLVGTTPNKNMERSLKALEGLPVELLILGRLQEKQREVLKNCGLPFKLYENLSDKEVADLYAESDILLYPSLYEGFGLPVIEAQKAGRIVITSDIEPMRSVAGSGAILVDPESVKLIRDSIVTIMQDAGLREKIVSEGFRNVERFDKNRICRQFVDLYRTILS
jgi:glycosyltransferase involved in cell wall biosynthesis